MNQEDKYFSIMPLVELERASLGGPPGSYHGLKPSASDDHTYSSNRGKLSGMTEVRRSRSEELSQNNQSAVKSAFTNFTESLSHSSEEFQDSVHKTFSSIASTFSRDHSSNASASGTGYDGSSASSSSSSTYGSDPQGSAGIHNLTWSEFVFPDNLRSRISSLTSRSSSGASRSSHEDSSLSSRSQSPSNTLSVTVDSTGIVLRESSEDDTRSTASSAASWHETASRDRSLLDTIGESNDEDDRSCSSSSSSSGSDDDDDDELEGEGQEIGEDGIAYDYEDDNTEFDSDGGLEELGAVMLQYGSCQFEPESASFDDEDYYYQSEGFSKNAGADDDDDDDDDTGTADETISFSEADRSALFQKQLQQRQRTKKKDDEGIAALFTKAFSCGAGTY